MEKIELTHQEKLEAISAKYYSHIQWIPKKGDYYSTVRNDLELYQIVDEDDQFFYTKYCNPERGFSTSKWEKENFLKDFGVYRLFIPNWILKIS